MRPRPRSIVLIHGAVGAFLLLDLVLPIANLLAHVDASGWFAALREPGAGAALRTSVLSSAITVLLMTVFGVPLGHVLARGRLPGKQLLISLVFLPMVVPGLAGGILLLLTFGPYGTLGAPLAPWNVALTGNLAGIVLAQLYVASPFVVISAMVAFNGVDPKLEMAAAMLGDSPWQIFRRISLPLAWPGIAAGITLAWIRALGEFGATMIVAYNPHTLPVYLWTKFESNGLPGALPVAFLLVVLAAGAVAVSTLLNRLARNGGREGEHPREALALPGGAPGNPA
jgi:molybdate/tungstate transport system permease protein